MKRPKQHYRKRRLYLSVPSLREAILIALILTIAHRDLILRQLEARQLRGPMDEGPFWILNVAEHEAAMAAEDLAALQLPGHWAAQRPEPPAPPDQPEPEPGADSQSLFHLIGYTGVRSHTRPLHPDTYI